MAITYNAGTNTITVTGYTSGTPCTFTDIYNADIAGGWGVVALQGTSQFLFDCKLVVGDGSTATYFADVEKQVTFSDFFTSADAYIKVRHSATFILGTLLDASAKTGGRGCCIIFNCNYGGSYTVDGYDSSSIVYLYGSTFINIGTATYLRFRLRGVDAYAHRVYCCTVTNDFQFNFCINDTDFKWLTALSCEYLFHRSSGIIANVNVFNGVGIAYAYSTDTTIVKNVFARGNTRIMEMSNAVVDSYLIDVDADNWLFKWSGTCSGEAYRQYTFNLQVIEEDGTAIQNATVTLTDKDDTEIFSLSTDANGDIAEQTVSRGYYDQAHGDTLQDYGPFTLTVEKANFETYVHEGIVLDEPIDWRIALLDKIVVEEKHGSWGLTQREYDQIIKDEVEPYQMATAILLLQRKRDKRIIKVLANE